MNLDKDTVRYLNMQPCFACKYSQIDSFDWGLRCCNSDSEHCTDYCPDKQCELYEQRNMERLRFVNAPFENEPTFETCQTFFANDDYDLLNALGYTLMRLRKYEPRTRCFSQFWREIHEELRKSGTTPSKTFGKVAEEKVNEED